MCPWLWSVHCLEVLGVNSLLYDIYLCDHIVTHTLNLTKVDTFSNAF